MRNHPIHVFALALGGLFILACSNNDGANDDANIDGSTMGGEDGPSPVDQMPAGFDTGLGCCPTGFDLYSCQTLGGAAVFACHNPAMGCASSQTCGQGCDPQVSGRCACVQTELCIRGDHFDTTLCQCVPDAAPIVCNSATDCTGALPALCQQCADGGTGCAHFACVAGQCQVVYCP